MGIVPMPSEKRRMADVGKKKNSVEGDKPKAPRPNTDSETKPPKQPKK